MDCNCEHYDRDTHMELYVMCYHNEGAPISPREAYTTHLASKDEVIHSLSHFMPEEDAKKMEGHFRDILRDSFIDDLK